MPNKTRRWLIDAFNLMHQLPGYKKKLDSNHVGAMQEFCQVMAEACRRNKRQAQLVFDGIDQHLTGSYARVQYQYGNGRTADELIIEMMQQPDAHRRWIVVTDDREIRAKAFYHKVEIFRCGDFIETILEPPEEPADSGTVLPPPAAAPPEDPGGNEDPDISEEEYNMMMQLFNSKK